MTSIHINIKQLEGHHYNYTLTPMASVRHMPYAHKGRDNGVTATTENYT
jgi:hypothetical protein